MSLFIVFFGILTTGSWQSFANEVSDSQEPFYSDSYLDAYARYYEMRRRRGSLPTTREASTGRPLVTINISSESDGGFKLCDLNVAVQKDVGELVLRVKSEAELNQWMQCHTQPRQYDNYTRLLPFMRAAADSFDVPLALLACTVWQESKFNSNARSNQGALGLGQIRPQTANTLRGLMASDSDVEGWRERLNTHLTNPPGEQSHKSRWDGWHADRRMLSNRLLSAHRANFMKPGWQAYAVGARAIGATPQASSLGNQARQLSPESLCGRGRCTENHLLNPLWSIGATAMHLQDLMLEVDVSYFFERVQEEGLGAAHQGFFVENRSLEGTDNPIVHYGATVSMEDFLVLVGAAYNAGTGRTFQTIFQNGEDLSDWIQVARVNNQESCRHMAHLATCMAPGHFKNTLNNPVGNAQVLVENRNPDTPICEQETLPQLSCNPDGEE